LQKQGKGNGQAEAIPEGEGEMVEIIEEPPGKGGHENDTNQYK